MKLFLDTADIEEIRTAARWGVLDGVTTNPTLYAKVGGSYEDILERDLRASPPGPCQRRGHRRGRRGHAPGGPRLRQARAQHRGQGAHERGGPRGHLALRRGGHQDQLHAHLQRQPGPARGQGRCLAAVAVRGPARRHQPGRHGRHPGAGLDRRDARPRDRGARGVHPASAPRHRRGAGRLRTSRHCRSRCSSRWSTTRSPTRASSSSRRTGRPRGRPPARRPPRPDPPGGDEGRPDGPAGLEERVRRLGPAARPGSAPSSWPRDAEARGFESLWVFDHFTRSPEPTDEITFESFSMLAALAMVTSRVRLGHMVVCTGVPQPGADGQARLDPRHHLRRPVRAGHRRGLEGGRVARLRLRLPATSASGWTSSRDHLEVITRMLGPGRATYSGQYAHVDGRDQRAQGHPAAHPDHRGRQRARADRRSRRQVRGRAQLRVRRDPPRCASGWPRSGSAASGRARPDTLRFSLYTLGDDDLQEPGRARIELLAAFAATGLDRLACFPGRWDTSVEGQERFAQDCEAAGGS